MYDCLETPHRVVAVSSVQLFSLVKLSFPRDCALVWEPTALSCLFRSWSVYFKAQGQFEQPAGQGTLAQEHPSGGWHVTSREPETQVGSRGSAIY